MGTISERILKRRTELGLTQEELANAINGSQQEIYRYETNKYKPSLEKLIKLSDALNTSLDWLVGKDGELALTDEEMLLLDLYRAKDQTSRAKMLDIAKVL